jgi:hypothetical protein
LNRDVLTKLVELTRVALDNQSTSDAKDWFRDDDDDEMKDVKLGAQDSFRLWQPFESDYWLTLGAVGHAPMSDGSPGSPSPSATMVADLPFLTSPSFYGELLKEDDDKARPPPYLATGQGDPSLPVAVDADESASRASSYPWQLYIPDTMKW